MKLRSLHGILIAIVSTVGILAHSAIGATGGNAPRQLLENLYTASGAMPIRDLVVELECADTDSASGSLTLSSKDKIYYKYPNKLRIDALIQDPGGPMDQKQMIVIRDGTTCWQYVSMGQYPVKKVPDTPKPTLNLPFGIQKYSIDNVRQYAGAGAKDINGVNAVAVKITNPQDSKDVRTVYVDTKRNCPVRLEQTRAEKSGPVNVRVDYKNIKQLPDKRFFPFTIEIYENNTLVKIRTCKGVQANVGLNDSLFQQMDRFVR